MKQAHTHTYTYTKSFSSRSSAFASLEHHMRWLRAGVCFTLSFYLGSTPPPSILIEAASTPGEGEGESFPLEWEGFISLSCAKNKSTSCSLKWNWKLELPNDSQLWHTDAGPFVIFLLHGETGSPLILQARKKSGTDWRGIRGENVNAGKRIMHDRPPFSLSSGPSS